MKITEDLIQRFFKGQCNAHEANIVGNYLTQQTDEAQKESDFAEWKRIIDATTTSLPVQQSNRLLKNIKDNINQSRLRFRISYKWTIAATFLLVAFAGLGFYFSNQQHTQSLPVNKDRVNTQQVINTGHKIMVLTLNDGTKVSLYPNSQISFAKHAFISTRVISLEGKALFDVAKDKSRPFIVKSAAVSTTALGTVFMVDAAPNNKSIIVQLFEGSVLVRSLNPLSGKQNPVRLMEPDQQLVYEKYNGRISLHTLKMESAKGVVKELRSARALKTKSANIVFIREPIENVFSIIGQAYATDLFYQKNNFQNHFFSGTFHMEKDSLNRVLRILSETNHLNIIKIKTGYQIKKSLTNK